MPSPCMFLADLTGMQLIYPHLVQKTLRRRLFIGPISALGIGQLFTANGSIGSVRGENGGLFIYFFN